MKRPDGVTVIAVWYFIDAVFSFMIACTIVVVLAGIFDAIGDQTGQFWASFGMLCAVVFIGVSGIAAVAAGWGLLQMKQWARWLAFILAIFTLFLFPIGTVIGALIIWYLLKDDVREAFEEAEGFIPAEVMSPEEEIAPE
jgi:hypothetical protein